MKRIYIHDACVLFDLIQGGIIHLWFELGYETRTSHLVFNEVEEDEQVSVLQPYIAGNKLVLETIGQDDLPGLMGLAQAWRVSLADVSVYHLAKIHGGILLSGDKRLRSFSGRHGVEVRGVLWVLDQLVEQKLLAPRLACQAMGAMLEAGARLPEEECRCRKIRWSSLSPG